MKRYHVQNERMRLSMAGLPAVLGFLCLYIVPVGMTIWYSFLENSFTMIFAGVDNYLYIWANEYFQLAVRNTICLTVTLVASAAMVSVIIGYLHHRYTKSNGAGTLFLLLPLLIPSGAVVSIWKTVFSTSSFSGTMQSYAAITSLFVWKYAGFGAVLIDTGLQRIPNEISQAAEIDGASGTQLVTRIVLPLARPSILVTAVMILIYVWNEYLFATTFMTGAENYTLAAGLYSLQATEMSGSWPVFAAASLVVSLPILIVFFAVQRHMTSGLTAGGVKG